MSDFLRGWRRKIGLVVLGLAMLLTVGWFRSMVIRDERWTVLGGDRYGTESANGNVQFFREANTSYDIRDGWYVTVVSSRGLRERKFDSQSYGEKWSGSVAGVSIQCLVQRNGPLNRLGQVPTFHVIRCPYWEPTLVLTLVAAAMILPPPRRVARRLSETPSVTSTAPSSG